MLLVTVLAQGVSLLVILKQKIDFSVTSIHPRVKPLASDWCTVTISPRGWLKKKQKKKMLCFLALALLFGNASAGCTVDKVTCYQEPNQKHMWKDAPNTMSTGMSQEWCAQLCSKAGHKMAGVEYGNQCYVSCVLCRQCALLLLSRHTLMHFYL